MLTGLDRDAARFLTFSESKKTGGTRKAERAGTPHGSTLGRALRALGEKRTIDDAGDRNRKRTSQRGTNRNDYYVKQEKECHDGWRRILGIDLGELPRISSATDQQFHPGKKELAPVGHWHAKSRQKRMRRREERSTNSIITILAHISQFKLPRWFTFCDRSFFALSDQRSLDLDQSEQTHSNTPIIDHGRVSPQRKELEYLFTGLAARHSRYAVEPLFRTSIPINRFLVGNVEWAPTAPMCVIAVGLGLIDTSETGCAFSFFVGQLLRLRLLDVIHFAEIRMTPVGSSVSPCFARRSDLSGVHGSSNYIGFPAAGHTVTKGKRIRQRASGLRRLSGGAWWKGRPPERRLLSWKRRWGGRDNYREEANKGKCVSTEGDRSWERRILSGDLQ
ncbi:hypothetical protein EDB86DRAFT_2828860 [Lactarius hatsudake]|nr:hypothetical protein EDB86DRAFT_2828860 [Lactarius hatsudake]